MLDLFGAAPRYIGQVATRGVIPTVFDGNGSTWMARTFHYARDTITQVRVAFAHWYVSTADGTETNGGGTQTVEASIEYPSGTMHQLLFGGATTFGIPAGGTVWTDWLPINIPNNALFYIRHRRSGQTGVVYNVDPLGYVAGGDALNDAGVNQVMSGTVDDTGYNVYMYPAAIVGLTNRPSVAIIGDSRQSGIGDTTTDATGNVGEVSRAIGGQLAYINAGLSGETGSSFITNSAKRRPILQYGSIVACCFGANDLGLASDYEATMRSIKGLMGPRRMFQTTLPPGLGGSERVVFNDWVRAVPDGLSGCIEIADVMETSRNSGVWKSGYDSDGVHESTTGNLALVGAIPTGVFSVGGANYMPRIVMP